MKSRRTQITGKYLNNCTCASYVRHPRETFLNDRPRSCLLNALKEEQVNYLDGGLTSSASISEDAVVEFGKLDSKVQDVA